MYAIQKKILLNKNILLNKKIISSNEEKTNIIQNNDSQIIITMTTSPKRLSNIDSILDNILNLQEVKPDYVYLNIPYKFKRTGEEYDENKLNEYKNKYSKLRINRCEDIGPITKVSETLKLVNDQEAIIIIIDDDIKYPTDFLKNLIISLLVNNNCIIANSIWSDNTVKIKIIEGWKGICFRRSIFKEDFIDYTMKVNNYKHCYNSDDYVISRYINKNNISIKQPPYDCNAIPLIYSELNDALHKQDNIDHYERYKLAKEYFDNLKL